MAEQPIDTNPRDASPHTRERNSAAVVDFDDAGDWERAQQGLVATLEDGRVVEGDRVVWDVAQYDFIRDQETAPDTVHPGLWRQARLNCVHGLFEVTEGVWQARGYDLANITFIAGETGWVLIDPLTTASTAAACLDLANRVLGERPVRAVIYTHSHVDHYGGVEGVTSAEEAAAGNVRIIAPDGFLHEAVSENVIAGPAMARRAAFQFGPILPKGPREQVDAGLGKGVPLGPPGLIAPTETIRETGEELDVDGVRIVFQNTPNAEAPAEMNFHFPEKRILCMAENCTHTLHNVYPIRGAQVRDALAWSKYIHEALYLFGDETDVSFSSHHWPRFGQGDVRAFLERQRDVYRWLNDQTMRLANKGYRAIEIAEELEKPTCFANHSDVAGYYGTISHNVKSVYNRYLGWYDGNPANLNPLPPEPAAERYLEFMGGAAAVLERARACFERGEYRWVAQVVNHVIFAEPDNAEARDLQAAAFEQMGYQAESSTWRNAYLQGARELRHGVPPIPLMLNIKTMSAMTADQVFDTLAVRFDPDRYTGGEASINVTFEDLDERHVLGITQTAVHHRPHHHGDDAALEVSWTRQLVGSLLLFQTTPQAAVESGELTAKGDLGVLDRLLDAIERPALAFPLAEPRRRDG